MKETATRKYSVLIIVLLFIQIRSIAQDELFPGLTGSELLTELVDEYKPHTVLNYGVARDLMYGEIYNENDSVSCVYSGHKIYLPPNVDPSSFLYMNGIADGINTEHTYPRSKGANENNGNAFSDMHHLFPTRTSVNSSRGNFPFGEIDDNQTTSWFYLNNNQSTMPNFNIDLYSERMNGIFEPKEAHKGNVARAIFYFFTMYREDALEADPDFFEQQRLTLCDWHELDPIDSLEWERTYMIAQHQSDMPNPFVLDPTLVTRSYCSELVSVPEHTTGTNILIYPNPIVSQVSIKSEGQNKLLVMDAIGNKVQEKEFKDAIELDFSSLISGHYYIIVNGQASRVLKL